MPRHLCLEILDPVTSRCLKAQAEDRVPRWAAWLVDQYIFWYLTQTFTPAIHHANAQGIGYRDSWLPPGTDAQAVVAWFEAQIMAAPLTRIGAVDYVLCYVFHCSVDEQPGVAWNNVPPKSQEIGQWDGPMRQWGNEGAAVIAGLVPHDHGGLYLLANRVRDAVQSLTTYRGSDGPPPDRRR
ncbi:hypothetical protein EKD04_018015 [Chloroflexales bacterium ZM16-3]|nr:hypothetical protein [Chloroflexales bacterium ZM16-3]